MDLHKLKLEQKRLARKVSLKDSFTTVKTIGAAACSVYKNKLIASVIVCDFPSLKMIEKKKYVLENPLPYRSGFKAYREMPAIIEAFNLLECEPDVLLVDGCGINHLQGLGLASHLGLALNVATIGITSKLPFGKIEKSKILVDDTLCGFEIKTKEHANSIYIVAGHNIAVGSVLHLIPKLIVAPHKLPEPLHIAMRIAKKKAKVSEE